MSAATDPILWGSETPEEEAARVAATRAARGPVRWDECDACGALAHRACRTGCENAPARPAERRTPMQGEGCGCGAADCYECMARRADGWRPTAAGLRAFWSGRDADLAAAQHRATAPAADPWALPELVTA